MNPIDIIEGKLHDLGGFNVRRVLPTIQRRTVGPFIFFDHMGPASFRAGDGVDVRPHPHINLATVTYLFEGCIHHRDSLGSDQLIEPGAVNWMVAGHGIVHSERAPATSQSAQTRMHGIQLWVALPEEQEETKPFFSHHPKNTLPEFSIGEVQCKLLLGKALGHESPVPVLSDLFYFESVMPANSTFDVQVEDRECAFYLIEGSVEVEGNQIRPNTMVAGKNLKVQALQNSKMMFLGGTSVGPRSLFWNFASSSKERLEEAKKDWALGPRAESSRFQPIPGDDQEFIPLPKN